MFRVARVRVYRDHGKNTVEEDRYKAWVQVVRIRRSFKGLRTYTNFRRFVCDAMKTFIINFLNKRIYRYLYFKTINLFFLRIRLKLRYFDTNYRLIARKESNKNVFGARENSSHPRISSKPKRERERGEHRPSSFPRAKRVIMRLRCKSRLTRKKDRIGAQPDHCSVNAPSSFVRDTTRLFLCFENRSVLCATASKYQSMANNKCNKRTSKLKGGR